LWRPRGGDRIIDRPEKERKEDFCTWINRFTDVTIYWEQKNDRYPCFSVTGSSGRKPDLLLAGDRTIAIEFKPGNDSSDVYQQLYDTGEATYLVQDEEIDVDVFAVANSESRSGRLFKESREFPRDTDEETGRIWAVRKGNIPQREYNRTEAIVRVMMRFSRKFVGGSTGIGAVLSSALDGDCPPVPGMLVYDGGDGWSWDQVE